MSHLTDKDPSSNVMILSELDSLIESLETARKMGFGSTTSPTGFLLEAAIDLSLLLGKSLEEGNHPEKLNQGLKELDKTDALGNQPLVRVGPKTSQDWWDPEAGRFVKHNLASFLILLKRHTPWKHAYRVLFPEESHAPDTSVGAVDQSTQTNFQLDSKLVKIKLSREEKQQASAKKTAEALKALKAQYANRAYLERQRKRSTQNEPKP